MKALIEDILCEGDPIRYEYVHRWIAYMFQFPTVLPEAALVFRGKQGTGKGTFANALMKLVGAHGYKVTTTSHLLGRFNLHLRDVILLYADEAFSPTDRAGANKLKALVTEKFNSYEGKGKDVVMGRNLAHVVMTSNEDWVVPAAVDDRRYFVSDVSDAWCNDRAKFTALRNQMKAGGYEAWLHDMLHYPLDGWTPAGPPDTAARADQKIASMGIIDEFLLEMLTDASLAPMVAGVGEAGTGNDGGYEFEWSEECKDVVYLTPEHKAKLLLKARAFAKESRVRSTKPTLISLLKKANKMGVVPHKGPGGERQWRVPPLAEARANWEKAYGVKDYFE